MIKKNTIIWARWGMRFFLKKIRPTAKNAAQTFHFFHPFMKFNSYRTHKNNYVHLSNVPKMYKMVTFRTFWGTECTKTDENETSVQHHPYTRLTRAYQPVWHVGAKFDTGDCVMSASENDTNYWRTVYSTCCDEHSCFWCRIAYLALDNTRNVHLVRVLELVRSRNSSGTCFWVTWSCEY